MQRDEGHGSAAALDPVHENDAAGHAGAAALNPVDDNDEVHAGAAAVNPVDDNDEVHGGAAALDPVVDDVPPNSVKMWDGILMYDCDYPIALSS